jgi:hypothetical protein
MEPIKRYLNKTPLQFENSVTSTVCVPDNIIASKDIPGNLCASRRQLSDQVDKHLPSGWGVCGTTYKDGKFVFCVCNQDTLKNLLEDYIPKIAWGNHSDKEESDKSGVVEIPDLEPMAVSYCLKKLLEEKDPSFWYQVYAAAIKGRFEISAQSKRLKEEERDYQEMLVERAYERYEDAMDRLRDSF